MNIIKMLPIAVACFVQFSFGYSMGQRHGLHVTYCEGTGIPQPLSQARPPEKGDNNMAHIQSEAEAAREQASAVVQEGRTIYMENELGCWAEATPANRKIASRKCRRGELPCEFLVNYVEGSSGTFVPTECGSQRRPSVVPDTP